jgi:hypothetical protein
MLCATSELASRGPAIGVPPAKENLQRNDSALLEWSFGVMLKSYSRDLRWPRRHQMLFRRRHYGDSSSQHPVQIYPVSRRISSQPFGEHFSAISKNN